MASSPFLRYSNRLIKKSCPSHSDHCWPHNYSRELFILFPASTDFNVKIDDLILPVFSRSASGPAFSRYESVAAIWWYEFPIASDVLAMTWSRRFQPRNYDHGVDRCLVPHLVLLSNGTEYTSILQGKPNGSDLNNLPKNDVTVKDRIKFLLWC